MIPKVQQQALEVLRELLALHPGVRIGQLFDCLGLLAEDEFGQCLGNVDDDQLLAVMYRHREELSGSISALLQDPDTPLTPEQEAELKRRIALWDADPNRGIPWETVRDEARKRRGKA